MSDPFSSPSLWDRLELHGPQGRVTVPGVAKVNVDVGISEDSVDIPNKNGTVTTTTHLGYKPAEISVEVQVWERAQFERLRDVLRVFRPKQNKTPSAVDAVHPQLELFGIRQVYIFAISAPSYSPAEGFRLTLQLREWRAETKGATAPIAKITGSSAGGAGATGGKPASGNASSEGSDWGQSLKPVKPSTVTQTPRKP